MDKIKKLLLYIFNLMLYWISKLISKDEKLWIFGSWFGKKYADNSKYLFEYINSYHPEIRAVWITDDIAIVNELKSKEYEVYKRYSIKSILIGIKAKYAIVVQSNLVDLMPFLNNNRTELIQLWHGIPLKKIGYDDNLIKINKFKSTIKYFLFPFLKEDYKLIIASSEEDKSNFTTAFLNKNIFITGYPRNDLLLNTCKKDKFTVTYLPTFRDAIGDKIDLFINFNFNIEEWNNTLEKFNIILNIKMHPVNKPKDEILLAFKQYKSLNFLDETDATEILPHTDILITDYSSVYFDFLLTDKPIIFTPFDYDNYIIKNREFYYKYDEVTPGPKCKNWDEVLEWIIKFQKDSGLYNEERKLMKSRFHKYNDGKNSERTFYKMFNNKKINI
jgi:CDP-glycerol glycerophosphotransferase (TagB/SpsB family)